MAIQIIGLLLVVLSVGFVAYQTRQVAKQAEFTVRESEYSRMAAIDEIFVRDPEMYPYFYDGKPLEETHPKYEAVLTVAMAMTNYLSNIAKVFTSPIMPQQAGEPLGE